MYIDYKTHKMLNDYRATVDREKKLMEGKYLIEIGKTPHENFNAKCMPEIPKEIDANFSLTMSLFRLITGLDSTNLNLIEADSLWKKLKCEERFLYNTFLFSRIWKLNTYIIHDIKFFIDMMIGLTWWLSQKTVECKIEISSIGEYLKKSDKDFVYFEEYRDFFLLINNIENAHKHSLPNIHNNLISADEPSIFALSSPYNKDIFRPSLIGITLNELVKEFNKFYHFSLSNIDALCQRKVSGQRSNTP